MNASESERVAMFRYGVIAALVCRRLENRLVQSSVRHEILSKEWAYPDGSVRKVPERTLREWLGRYRRYGVDGLYDGLRKERKNKGRFRAIPSETLRRAEQLRRELPERSSKAIMELLKLEGIETSGFSERSLQRHLKRLDATRIKLKGTGILHHRWEQLHANDLWHGDTAHAVWLPDPNNPNKMKRTKLIAFVDDASRVCTHGEFYFDERLPNLIDTFSKALLKRGKPRRLLLDNAFIFHSTALEVMCAELETELSFCRPRRPQGKGKIERLIRTIKDSFVSEANRAGFTSLAELNQAFAGWLEVNYHNRKHSEIEQTPLERWRKDEATVSAVTPEHIRRALMMRTKRHVQQQTGTIYLDGLEYTCSKEMAGRTVEVRWHVDVIDSIEVWLDGRFVETARLSERPTTLPKFAVAVEEESYPTIESAKSRMEHLRMITGVEPAGPRSDEFLSVDGFIKLTARYLERGFSQPELERLAKFFRGAAPLRKEAVEEALKKTVSVKGSSLHLRYYLEHLSTAARAGRK
jgi:transposase InsO family protein